MKTIELSDETFAALRAEVKDFGDTPDTVIRRLLSLSAGKQEEGVCREIYALVNSSQFQHFNGRDRYFAILKVLHDIQPGLFTERAPGLKFGKRVQIAETREEIESSGKSTYPEQIPGTNLWALTNLSNRSKRDVILAVMQRLGYPQKDIRFAIQTIPDTASSRSSAGVLINDLV